MWRGLDADLDSGGDWLVTNITQELSAGLDSIPHLDSSIFDFNCIKSERLDENCDNSIYEFPNEEYIKIEEEGLYDERLLREQTSSSGSEASYQCSSSRINSEELDTPPTTPPNIFHNAEHARIMAGSDITCLPISSVGKVKTVYANSTKAIAAKTSEVSKTGVQNVSNNVTRSKENLHEQQVRRRQERMIRNRESAYLSRKRAKEHVSLLERQVQELTHENTKLLQENSALRERLSSYEGNGCKLPLRRFAHVPKKTTALLIISVTLCFNIHSLRLFEEGVSSDGGGVKVAPFQSHHARSLLWVEPLDHHTLSNLTTSCPVPINKSESLRLERELREWIGTEVPIRTGAANISTRRNKRIPRSRRPKTFPLDTWSVSPSLFGLDGLYENIERRADTFYLVSFSPDHLLLPAMARNETSRPKISVMLPASLANSSGRVEMMQIDCEVTNTQLLSVREQLIPIQLRPIHKFLNQTFPSTEPVYENNSSKNANQNSQHNSNNVHKNKTLTSGEKLTGPQLYNSSFSTSSHNFIEKEKSKLRNYTESPFNLLFPFKYYEYGINNSSKKN